MKTILLLTFISFSAFSYTTGNVVLKDISDSKSMEKFEGLCGDWSEDYSKATTMCSDGTESSDPDGILSNACSQMKRAPSAVDGGEFVHGASTTSSTGNICGVCCHN